MAGGRGAAGEGRGAGGGAGGGPVGGGALDGVTGVPDHRVGGVGRAAAAAVI